MKIFVAVLAIAAFVACGSAAVLPEFIDEELIHETESVQGPLIEDQSNVQPHSRQRRFTCDVFSFKSKWVTPNHTACAAKCIGMGRKGGHCENNNCVCRNDRYIG